MHPALYRRFLLLKGIEAEIVWYRYIHKAL